MSRWKGEVKLEALCGSGKTKFVQGVKWKTQNLLCCMVGGVCNHEFWHLYKAYKPSRYAHRRRFQVELSQRIGVENMPWIMFRDLNEIIDESERFGGRNLARKRLFLKGFMQQVGAIDLSFNGRKYTQINKQQASTNIRWRLDKAIANSEWLNLLPKARVQHLPWEELDHVPLLISTGEEDEIYKMPFRFLHAWVTNISSFWVVKEVWDKEPGYGTKCYKISRELKGTAVTLRVRNRQSFGLVYTWIHELEKQQLPNVQTKDDAKGGDLSPKKYDIFAELKEQRRQWESILKQKSRELWLKVGVKNSKFFFASILVRRRQNQIFVIQDRD